jgi:ATP-binding cassette, subfamily B (MDR/TAP), member 1
VVSTNPIKNQVLYSLELHRGSKQVREGHYSTQDFFIVLPSLLFSAQATGQMFSLAPEITRAKSGARSVFNLHDQKPSIMAIETSTPPSEKPSLPPSPPSEKATPKGTVEFRNVHLTYRTRRGAPALNGISLTIPAGSTAAFVGRSGAGKTSCISLLTRFYDPTAGAVVVDAADIRAQPVAAHRARLALVPQDPDLFPGSLAFNVGLGAAPGVPATQPAIEAACARAGLHDFVASLPDGYATECGPGGAALSGGQRQRVAIARALLRDPEILLLDEATSQLDATSETEVRAAIAEASRGRTTIVVAHRLASVQSADRIFVFDAGRIVEEGTHVELVGKGGVYASMVEAQELD